MAQDIAAVLYVGCCPTIEFRDGMVHIFFDAGKRARFEVVMSPANYIKAHQRGSEAVAKWQVEQLGKVEDIR